MRIKLSVEWSVNTEQRLEVRNCEERMEEAETVIEMEKVINLFNKKE